MKSVFKNLLIFILCLAVLPASAEGLITLPESLTAIEAGAFAGDTSLRRVVVPDGVVSIGSGAFADSSLARITLPDSVTSIADDAFSGCSPALRVSCSPNSPAAAYCAKQGIKTGTKYNVGILAREIQGTDYEEAVSAEIQNHFANLSGNGYEISYIWDICTDAASQMEYTALFGLYDMDVIFIDIIDPANAEEICELLEDASCGAIFYNTDPGSAIADYNAIYVGPVSEGTQVPAETLGQACAEMFHSYIETGSYLADTAYTSADGWSVRLNGEQTGEKDKTQICILLSNWNSDSNLHNLVPEAIKVYAEELGLNEIEWTCIDGQSDGAKQVEQACAYARSADIVLVDLAELSAANDVAAYIADAGVPFLFYNTEPSANLVTNYESIYVGMERGKAMDAEALSYAVANQVTQYMMNGRWDYSNSADGWSVRVGAEQEPVQTHNVSVLTADSSNSDALLNALYEYMYACAAEMGLSVDFKHILASGSGSEQKDCAQDMAVDGTDLMLIELADVSKAADIAATLEEYGVPFLFYYNEPAQSIVENHDSIFVGMADGEHLNADALAAAVAAQATYYFASGGWNYGNSADGWSVRVSAASPYDPVEVHVLSSNCAEDSELRVYLQEYLAVYLMEMTGVKPNITIYDAMSDGAKQAEQACVASMYADIVLVDLAEISAAGDVADFIASAGVPFLFYNSAPNSALVKQHNSIYVGMKAGKEMNAGAIASAVAGQVAYYLGNDGWNYSNSTDGWSVRIS